MERDTTYTNLERVQDLDWRGSGPAVADNGRLATTCSDGPDKEAGADGHTRHARTLANKLPRIQTWALEEARRRLEAEGILAEPTDKTA